MSNNEATLCMTPDCNEVRKTRGLCKRCYGAACQKVRIFQDITWKKLEDLGLCLRKQEQGNRGLFAKALAEALEHDDDG